MSAMVQSHVIHCPATSYSWSSHMSSMVELHIIHGPVTCHPWLGHMSAMVQLHVNSGLVTCQTSSKMSFICLYIRHVELLETETPHQFNFSLQCYVKAILRDLLISAPSIYILLNKFSTVYINQ